MRVAFLLNDLQLSGGVGVVLTHARNLASHHDVDVTLVVVREHEAPDWSYEHLEHLHVMTLAQAREQRFDVAVSTWWETAYTLFLVPAARYASFVQSLEDRFYPPSETADRLGARVTLGLPVAFITEAHWIAETLAELRPDAAVHLVRNGIDKAVFAPVEEIDENASAPLRVLVEGNPGVWFKGVGEAIAAIKGMDEPHELTIVTPTRDGLAPEDARHAIGPLSQRELADVYARTDVLVKLSRVEGMYGPPLEGFHRGATCVTTQVTGFDEYIRHGENALVVDWDDERGTSRQLDLLARDRELLHRLRRGALATARDWPGWEAASTELAAALHAIAAAPAPDPYAHVPRLLADVRAGIEAERGLVHERRQLIADARRWERISRLPVLGRLFAARRRLKALAQRSRSGVRRS